MYKIKSLVMGLAAIFLLAIAPLAIAQTNDVGNGLQISPTRTEMSVLPGESKEFTVTVKNIADAPLKMRSSINDFESDGITGSPQIIVNEDRQVSTSLKDYVQGLGEFEIAAGESKELKLSVNMPSDAAPGAYYGAIRVTVIPNDNATAEGTQVSLNASVASLLFVEVSGDITQQISVEEMKVCSVVVTEQAKSPDTAGQGDGIQQNCDKGSSFFMKVPTVASIKIANKGNGFSRPFGRVAINRGSSEVYAYELNNSEPRGTILPNSTRVYSNKIQGVDKLGKYTMVASLSHGDGGEVIVEKLTFWYIPTWALAVLAALLVALIVGGVVLFKKIKKNRRK